MKIIKYKIKNTSASTTYANINIQDMDYVKKTMGQYLAYIAELDRLIGTKEDEVRKAMHTRTSELPKSKSGPNTIASFIGGLVNNLVYGSQYDLTIKQMSGIEFVSTVLSQLDANFDNIRFTQ